MRPGSRSTVRPASCVLHVAAVHDSGVIVNRAGADGQVYGGVVMGIGQALLEASQLSEEGASSTRTSSIQARHGRGRAAHRRRLDRDAGAERRPARNGGVGEPPTVPTPGAIAKRDCARDRGARARAPDDARAHMARGPRVAMTSSRRRRDRRGSTGAGGMERGQSRGDGPRRRRAPGERHRSRRASSPSIGLTGCAESRSRTARFGWEPRDHAELASHPVVRERLTALADASARVGSHATRAHGTIGGNLMNASPAIAGGPLMVFGATVSLRPAAASGGSRSPSSPRDPARRSPRRTSLTEVEIPLPPEGTGSAYARLEYRRHMEIAVVGATVAVTVVDGSVESAAVAITALAPTIRLVPEAADALVGTDGGGEAGETAARAAADAAEPISDVGPPPTTAGR